MRLERVVVDVDVDMDVDVDESNVDADVDGANGATTVWTEYPWPVAEAVANVDQASDPSPPPSLPRPLVARVARGEMLFLPALWYHQVEQRTDAADADAAATDDDKDNDDKKDKAAPTGGGLCVAVNHWYDMDYDHRYVWQQAWMKLADAAADNHSNHSNSDK